ncbi:helix-turn-helix transcriptional regulator [Brevibacillus laterosporus]|uniref:helix-turn-helix transcriptional regulator n=1 Tax=Brevibacillus laterosporus TaxID=1465 RepID=UPI0018CE7D44|nr:helix-turn-helix transcriptional regulator [Brevibacillus laterosporus]MBG9786904.1 hypothetical protein [Brevibacillus laterosporus]
MAYYKVGRCRLGTILEENKMEQQQLADKVGMTKQQINNYCKNRTRMSLENAINIAKAVKRPVEELYEIKRYKDRTTAGVE